MKKKKEIMKEKKGKEKSSKTLRFIVDMLQRCFNRL